MVRAVPPRVWRAANEGIGLNTLRVALEQHFVAVDGCVYTDIAFNYDYWRQYLEVFDSVEPIARIADVAAVPQGWVRADGPRVRFRAIRDYRGLWQFLRRLPGVFADCRKAVAEPGPVLLRMGNISQMCWLNLLFARRPYAYEVVGHAGEGALHVRNVQRWGLNRLLCRVLHGLCGIQTGGAACASYVGNYVRGLYPTRSRREWVFSSVNLDAAAFGQPRPAATFDVNRIRIVSIGRMEPEKGHRTLLEAVAVLRRRGRTGLTVELAGPGSQIEPLRQFASESGLSDVVTVAGAVPPGCGVRAVLDRADLFVLPSLTEGMPRALLEAMAWGVPAIGSAAGGIMELLGSSCLVAPGEATALADKIAAAGRFVIVGYEF